MYINSFITELSKKIDTVEVQLKDFESKMDKINDIKLRRLCFGAVDIKF